MTPPDPAPTAPPQLVLLTRAGIIGRPPVLPRQLVQVPEWGGAVLVRGLTGRERDEWEVGIYQLVDREKTRVAAGGTPDPWYLSRNLRARLAVRTVCDDAGQLLFSPADEERLGQEPAAPLDRIYAVARRLSLIEEQDVQELVGKDVAGGSSDAGTASPGT